MTIELNPVGTACYANCEYCVVGGTPVLMADGSWRPIEDVDPGDEVLGFDETTPGDGSHRRIRRARVTATMSRKVETLRIETTAGSVECSPDHLWVESAWRWRPARRFKVGQSLMQFATPVDPPVEDGEYMRGYLVGMSEGDAMMGTWDASWRPGGKQYQYRLAVKDTEILDRVERYASALGFAPMNRRMADLGGGSELPALFTSRKDSVERLLSMVEEHGESRSYTKGYIAGIFDAEGSNTSAIRIANGDPETLRRIETGFDRLGFDRVADVEKANGVKTIRIRADMGTRMRFFGMVSPACERKIDAFDRVVRARKSEITAIEPAGVQRTYDLTTTTSTFVAGGFYSHNCYLEPQREGGNLSGGPYDMEAMKRGLMEEIGSWDPEGQAPFTLHGGDPLGMPIDDLEEILRWCHERWGATAIQTIGARMTEDHLDLWERYNTRVGISIDGPGEMNDLRKMRGARDVRDATEQTEWAIEAMRDRNISVSVIVVLHKLNMAPDRRDDFKAWISYLDRIGISGVRFHPMELDYRAEKWAPPVIEYVEFYRDLHDHMKDLRLSIDILDDMRKLLRGDDRNVTCTWHACDPMSTPAVRGVDGQGERTNCGRTNKDGVSHPKAKQAGHERQLALYRTPQEHGGCKGCEFWFACLGQCPGEGLSGDFRSRSGYCEMYKGLFRTVEQEMLDDGEVPLSMQSKREDVERLMDAHFKQGRRLPIYNALEKVDRGWEARPDGSMHGDAPHGDSHGDHVDRG